MDTIIRAPQLIDEKRLLSLGVPVLARATSGAALSEVVRANGEAESDVHNTISALLEKVADLERENERLRRELSVSNELRQKLEDDIDNEFDQARDDGFATGQKQGNERALTEWREQCERLKSIIDSAATSRAQIAKANEDVIAEVVYAATVRIIGQPMGSLASIRRVFGEVVADTGAASVVRLRVAKRDIELVEKLLVETFGNAASCQVVADDNVVLGGCVIEQECGSLDARLETQLEALRRAVMKPYTEVPHE